MGLYSFITAGIIGIIFIYSNLDWLGIVFLVIAVIALFYPKAKQGVETAWKDVKKTDALYPEKKFFDTYAKGFGKQAAEHLTPAPETQWSAKNWLHKSQSMATNFFKELDELFK